MLMMVASIAGRARYAGAGAVVLCADVLYTLAERERTRRLVLEEGELTGQRKGLESY